MVVMQSPSNGPRKQSLVLITEYPLFENVLKQDWVGNRFFGKKFMTWLYNSYLKKLASLVFSIWAICIIPGGMMYWQSNEIKNEALFYIAGSLALISQGIMSIFMQVSHLQHLDSNVENYYLIFHLLLESFSFCYLTGYSMKGVFAVLVVFVSQINAIWLDCFPKSRSRYKKAFYLIARLRRKLNERNNTPNNHLHVAFKKQGHIPWNPNKIQDIYMLLSDPDFQANIDYLADELNRLTTPDPRWPLIDRISFSVRVVWFSVDKMTLFACVLGFASKTGIYIMTLAGSIPFITENGSHHSSFINLIHTFRMSCVTSIIIYLKRSIYVLLYPFQMSTMTRKALAIPILHEWNDWMPFVGRRMLSKLLSPQSDSATSISCSSEDVKTNTAKMLNTDIGSHIRTSQQITAWAGSDARRQTIQHESSHGFSDFVIFSSSGRGHIISWSETLSNAFFPKSLDRSLKILSKKISSYGAAIWICSSILFGIEQSTNIHPLSGLSYAGYLLSCIMLCIVATQYNYLVLKRACFEFTPAFTLLNLTLMVVLWSIYSPFFGRENAVMAVSIHLACLAGLYIDAHPIRFASIMNRIGRNTRLWEGDAALYERQMIHRICWALASRLRFHVEPINTDRRKLGWSPFPSILASSSCSFSQNTCDSSSPDTRFKPSLSLLQKLVLRFQFGLQRSLFLFFGIFCIAGFIWIVEVDDSFVDAEIKVFGIMWSSRLLVRSSTFAFSYFYCRKVYDALFCPFAISSISQPPYIIPILPEIADGSLFEY